MKEKQVYTGKDVIDFIKEEKLEKVTIKCGYIHFNDWDKGGPAARLKINWGKNEFSKKGGR